MSTIDIQLAPVTIQDLGKLKDISRRTFCDTFLPFNTKENMESYLDNHLSDASLTGELLNPDSFFFFSFVGDQVCGYLKINKGSAQTVLPNDQALEIERIYVEASHKGKGIGKFLLEKATEIGRDLKAAYIWLGVWEHNQAAIRFYEKNGFAPSGQHKFRLGQDEQTDLIYRKILYGSPQSSQTELQAH